MMKSPSPAAGPHWCERCGTQYDDGCAVRVSCGLETPERKKLRADAVAAEERLNQIALDALGEDLIVRICGIDPQSASVGDALYLRAIRNNPSDVFIYIPCEVWPPGAQAAWDAREEAMEDFEAYGREPDVPAHLRARGRNDE